MYIRNNQYYMRYDFIAELFVKKDDKEPRYKTHLWGIKDEKNFIKEIGMTSCCFMWSDGDDYMKEMDLWELTEYFSLKDNPELAALFFEGEKCSKVVLYAYEVESGFSIGCNFGSDNCFFAYFHTSLTLDLHDDRVCIVVDFNNFTKDSPCRDYFVSFLKGVSVFL